MWEFITMGNQWTQYSNHILNFITINTNDDDNNPNVYPFCLSDGNIIPTHTNGYLYCLVSTCNKDQIYIGEANCLYQRLIQHNSGRGSQSTQEIMDIPWYVTSYICGLSHMNKVHRIILERRWKLIFKIYVLEEDTIHFLGSMLEKILLKHTMMETVITKIVLLDVSL